MIPISHKTNKDGPEIDDQEIKFWKKKIRKYLKPLEQDKNKEKAATEALIELRNSVCLGLVKKSAISNLSFIDLSWSSSRIFVSAVIWISVERF
jgi:hypothetical protein